MFKGIDKVDVSNDFNIDKDSPESYIQYLNYRTYEYQARDITFYKKTGHELYFKAYSDAFQCNVLIVIDNRAPGKVYLKILNKH